MSLSMLGLAPSAELIIEIADAETRKKVEVKNDKNQKVKKNHANAHQCDPRNAFFSAAPLLSPHLCARARTPLES